MRREKNVGHFLPFGSVMETYMCIYLSMLQLLTKARQMSMQCHQDCPDPMSGELKNAPESGTSIVKKIEIE